MADGEWKWIGEVLKAVPVYEDAIQPLAKETGKALGTLGKVVNAALLPLNALVWKAEQINYFFQNDVANKLKAIPVERIVTPDPSIAVPAIEALRSQGNNEDLRDLFSSLLANAMDSETSANAHPAYVEVLRQMSGAEAKMINLFQRRYALFVVLAGSGRDAFPLNEHGDRRAYLLTDDITKISVSSARHLFVNLQRLGVVTEEHMNYQEMAILADHSYLDEHVPMGKFLSNPFDYYDPPNEFINTLSYKPTPFGKRFIAACTGPI